MKFLTFILFFVISVQVYSAGTNIETSIETATLLWKKDSTEKAIATLAEAYDSDPYYMEKIMLSPRYRLFMEKNQKNIFIEILSSEQFRKSDLNKRIIENRTVTEKIRREFEDKLEKIPLKDRPSKAFVAENACPTKCCSYQNFSETQDIYLYDSELGKSIIHEIPAKTMMKTLQTKLYLQPEPVVVVNTIKDQNTEVSSGEIIYFLEQKEDGYGVYSYQNKTITLAMSPVDLCLDHKCSLLYVKSPEDRNFKPYWWVEVETVAGKNRGWYIMNEIESKSAPFLKNHCGQD
jgi:hypothetical protein